MMILPDKKDAIHKAWLYRVLEAVADDRYLAEVLYFKGGTCASMLGWLDRFSVDLHFDFSDSLADVPKARAALEGIFVKLGLTIKDASKNGIQYFLRYDNPNGESQRNTLKIDASFPLFLASRYEPARLSDIDRVLTCQTIETMFSHKLVALIDRFEKTGAIAGRDVYDIHHFFLKGYDYDSNVIQERRGMGAKEFLAKLLDFIEEHVTERVIAEDLSPLMLADRFSILRKTLKREVLTLIKDEVKRLYNIG